MGIKYGRGANFAFAGICTLKRVLSLTACELDRTEMNWHNYPEHVYSDGRVHVMLVSCTVSDMLPNNETEKESRDFGILYRI